MNANKLEASRVSKQTPAPKNILSKAIEKVKNEKNVSCFNKKATVNRSNSLKDSGSTNLKSIIANSNSVSNLNVITETLNENETFLGNDSQSTLSNRSSLDDLNEEYTSNKYENGGYKTEMNYNEVRTYKMMNNKFSETYKEIIKSLLAEKLLAYQMQYQSYLPEGLTLNNDDSDSLNNYKQNQIEKKNNRRQKNLSISINNNNNNNVSNIRRGSNSFSGGIKPAIKLNRVATAYEKKNPRSPADPLNISTKFKLFVDSNTANTNTNVVNFATQKRPTLFSAPQSTVEEHPLQDSLFKKSFSKANSNLSYKSLCNPASYTNTNISRRSLLSSTSSQSNKSKLKTSESNISLSNKSESSSTTRLTDLLFDGYTAKKEIANVLLDLNEQDPNIYASTRNNKIEQEPDYLTPAFKIQKFDIKNTKELDQAKHEIYKRYAFIENPTIRANVGLNFSPCSKISTSFKRI